MNRAKITSMFARLVLAAITVSGVLAMGTPNAAAQAIIVTTPFAFSAGSQTYPAGTYEFTLLSKWSLSIRNVNGGGQKFFTVRPEDNSLPGSKGNLIFRNSDGQQTLQSVYVPGTGRTAALLQLDEIGNRDKSDRSLASLHTASGKVTAGKQNATGR
ncbi:hypothetical protein [Alloacidobacterium sp.]|uniref:hypothetical protein n=1 Tax=Alloacidobacterium sp. TaxID=2951999 RepID=UPI002D3242C3|nr:hypothetical protein [Alloacidobacterium sp.]HYK37151.1 hypothetical protein [Alloacidobacterium sp.]